MKKILLGLATGWPFVYMLLFFIFIFGIVLTSTPGPGDGRELNPLFGVGFFAIFIIHFFTIFLMLGLTVFYIIHAVKNTKLDSNMRIMWIILFFFASMIAQPIYWYLQIWRESPAGQFSTQLNPPPASVDNFQDNRSGTYVPPSEPPDWR